jgi:hypothetical protein
MLGRTEISAKRPNLNAAHETSIRSHVLAALIERCGVTDLNSLRETIASGRWRTQVEEMVTDWLQIKFVDGLRDEAALEAILCLRETQNIAQGARGVLQGDQIKIGLCCAVLHMLLYPLAHAKEFFLPLGDGIIVGGEGCFRAPYLSGYPASVSDTLLPRFGNT